MTQRIDGRSDNQVRSIKLVHNVYGNSQGSVLFSLGNTKVLCSVMLQDGVPHFLRGTGQGWLTAEYSMLPAATITRSPREASIMRRNNRSIEISRLIGRSLRAVIDLKKLGEKTVYIDCDVLQADGGTRTAAINGAYCAVKNAIEKWISRGIITDTILTDSLAAISVGWTENRALLDVNFSEDNKVDADFNFVMTGTGKIVEIQGATESSPLDWNTVLAMRESAFKGVKDIIAFVDNNDLLPITAPIEQQL
jgi:ribonuclease PH